MGSLWVALVVEEDPQGRGKGTTGQSGSRKWRGAGGRDVEQREQWEDLLVTRPESENDLSQTNRSVRGVFVGVVPRVQSILSRALHAHRGKKFLQSLLNVVSTTIKRTRYSSGEREKKAP